MTFARLALKVLRHSLDMDMIGDAEMAEQFREHDPEAYQPTTKEERQAAREEKKKERERRRDEKEEKRRLKTCAQALNAVIRHIEIQAINEARAQRAAQLARQQAAQVHVVQSPFEVVLQGNWGVSFSQKIIHLSV